MVAQAVTNAPPPEEPDGSADTQMFRRFVEGDDVQARPKAVGAPFRIATLLLGLVVFAGLVYLLLKL